jgi:hypothetical protein
VYTFVVVVVFQNKKLDFNMETKQPLNSEIEGKGAL